MVIGRFHKSIYILFSADAVIFYIYFYIYIYIKLIWILAQSKDKDPFSNILSLDWALREFTPLFLFRLPGGGMGESAG